MGQRLSQSQGVPNNAIATITPIGTVNVPQRDGSVAESTVLQVPTKDGIKTVIVPLNNMKPIDLGSVVIKPTQQGIISGTKTYYLCSVDEPTTRGLFGETKGRGQVIGYTSSQEGKCQVVFNGRPHAAEKHQMILDDGKYNWSRTPTTPVSYGSYGGDNRPICRVADPHNGYMYAGNVIDGKCIASNGTDVISGSDFEYLSHL